MVTDKSPLIESSKNHFYNHKFPAFLFKHPFYSHSGFHDDLNTYHKINNFKKPSEYAFFGVRSLYQVASLYMVVCICVSPKSYYF